MKQNPCMAGRYRAAKVNQNKDFGNDKKMKKKRNIFIQILYVYTHLSGLGLSWKDAALPMQRCWFDPNNPLFF